MSLQSTDPIADLITRVRNAIMVGKREVRVPTSKLKVAVVEELKKNHYIASYDLEKRSPRDILHVVINLPTETPTITEISKVSKPGRHVYVKAEEIPTVKSGRGTVLISTSKGLMNGREAKKHKVETYYCYSDEERVNAINKLGDNAEITRFKGLGEISPEEFVDFIGPEMRLDRVRLRKEDNVKQLLTFFMGKNTMERQNFIIDNLVIEDDEDITVH